MQKELIEHYRSIDFSFWEDEIDFLIGQKLEIDRTGNVELKNIHSIKLYTLYLQLWEIFCLHLLALSHNNLSWLFANNSRFENELKDLLTTNHSERKRFLNHFLDNFVFWIVDRSIISDYEEKRKVYFRILDEFIEDRSKDKELLNAYKHGFRVLSWGYVALRADNWQQITPHFDSTVTYFRREKGDSSNDYIFEHKLSFFSERINVKCHFMLNMLQNAKKIVCADSWEIQIETIYMYEKLRESFDKSFWSLRWKSFLFEIKKLPPEK